MTDPVPHDANTPRSAEDGSETVPVVADLPTKDWDDTSTLLHRVFHDERFADPAYLNWHYNESPVGTAIAVDLRDEHEEVFGHGAALPQEFRNAEGNTRFVQIVNIAILPGRRGENLFAHEILNHIPHVIEQGVIGGFGVTNANSTDPAISLDGLGATLVCQLPVKVLLPSPLWRKGVDTFAVTPDFLESKTFVELCSDLDQYPAEHWTQRWTLDQLRWRLSRPNTSYALHATNNVVAITSAAKAKGVPVVMLMKMLPRYGSRGPLPAEAIVTAACRHHRAPVAMYVGFNAHLPMRGVTVPRRFLPSPLNLLFLTLGDLDQASFRFDTFEFLDFDAF